MSAIHFRLENIDIPVVLDLDSRNETYLNRQKIVCVAMIRYGDVIAAGNTKFLVQMAVYTVLNIQVEIDVSALESVLNA